MRFERFSDALVAASLNGVVQGLLVIFAVWLGLRAVGRTNAATRHAVWFVTLLIVAALIPAQFLRDYLGSRFGLGQGIATRAGGSEPERPGSESGLSSAKAVGLGSRSARRDETARDHSLNVPPVGQEQTAPGIIPDRPVSGEPAFSLESSLAPPLELLAEDRQPGGKVGRADVVGRLASVLQPGLWTLLRPGTISPGVALTLLLLGLGVATVKVSGLVRHVADLRRLKRNSLPSWGILKELFANLRQRLGIRRRVSLKISTHGHCPMILGFFHPAVLLPFTEAVKGDPRAVEQILQHELAHVARRDDWANLCQNLIQAALFFHPGVWWVCRQLSLEREIACDDQVLQLGCRPRAYALLLADVAGRMAGGRPLLAPGVSTNKNQLTKRIDMILNTRRNISPRLVKTRLGFLTGAAAVTAVLALCTGPRLVLAQALARPPAAPATTPTPLSAAAPTSVAPAGAGLPTPPAVLTWSPAPGATYETVQVVPPGSPTPVEDDQGPKYKPDSLDQPALPPVVIALPPATLAPPAAALAPVPATPALPPGAVVSLAPTPAPGAAPLIVGIPRPEAAPMPPAGLAGLTPMPRDKRLADENRSVEARLRRLERMVDSLMAQEGPKQPGRNFDFNFDFKNKSADDAEAHAKAMKEVNEQVQRQVAQAAEQAKRAAEQAERAMRAQRDWSQDKMRDFSGKELEGLRRAREALGREMERLDRQIQRLEQDRERSKQDRGRMEKDKKDGGDNQDKSADQEENDEAKAETAAVSASVCETIP